MSERNIPQVSRSIHVVNILNKNKPYLCPKNRRNSNDRLKDDQSHQYA
jgi:hypothetical protein